MRRVNTPHCAVKFKLSEGEVEVSGGGLNGTYSTIQFHFHWGGSEHHPGSEHTIDGKRYPMEVERHTRHSTQSTPLSSYGLFIKSRHPVASCSTLQMHIVSLKKGLSVSEAVEDPMGIAALGFFINVRQHLYLCTICYESTH